MTSPSTTPILDLQEALPAKRRGTLRGFAIGLALGLLFAIIPSLVYLKPPRMLWPAIQFNRQEMLSLGFWDRQFFMGALLATWLAVFAAVVVHELGHFMAGRLLGFSLQALQLGPISIAYDHGNLRIRYQSTWGLGGFTAMQVPGISRLRRKLLLYVLAGPAINLLCFFAAIVVMRNFAADINPFAWNALTVFAAASLFAFAASIFPYQPLGGFYSDGARVKMLLLPNPEIRRWYAIIGLGMQRRCGRQPRDWNRRWLALASTESRRPGGAFIGKFLAFAAASDRKDAAAASALLESCLRDFGAVRPPVRDTIANEAAVFQAWFRNDAEKPRQWFARVQKPKQLTPLQRTRGAVALLFAGGNTKTAFEKWADGLEMIEQFKDAIQRETLKRSWLEWKQEMDQRLAVTVTTLA